VIAFCSCSPLEIETSREAIALARPSHGMNLTPKHGQFARAYIRCIQHRPHTMNLKEQTFCKASSGLPFAIFVSNRVIIHVAASDGIIKRHRTADTRLMMVTSTPHLTFRWAPCWWAVQNRLPLKGTRPLRSTRL